MNKALTLSTAIAAALLISACSHRAPAAKAVKPPPAPHVTLVPDDKHASLTYRHVGGNGNNPVTFFFSSPEVPNDFMTVAGEPVFDATYLKKIPAYLRRMAPGTDVIDQLVSAGQPIKVRAKVKESTFVFNGIPIPLGASKQPPVQVFTPKPLQTYLIETVLADGYTLSIYELSMSGERTLVSPTP
ncbi:hypothetical protein [Pseudomonas sp. CF161]|uniref:hypothetical protein n=1 Tax=Pseudomonas sp. CF161 TaxID=911241 RepID=UPI0003551E99|nr:hypothetical protein [Pseudomonas sp. CF161]EPL11259.1 hypothetical protein CF161_09006 [Pseudomonas sp. CF161]